MKTGIELIAEERREQVEKHGFTTEMDSNVQGSRQLARAAAVIVHPETSRSFRKMLVLMPEWNDLICAKICNKDYKERLKIAGALIAAELDRVMYEEANETNNQ